MKEYVSEDEEAEIAEVEITTRITIYSCLKHSIGSRLAAFFAGQTPKTNPTPIETVIPLTTAHIGIEAGSSGINNMNT